MNKKTKKFISPNAWFSFEYPQNWNEFEDSESTFLFYNPDKWTGNFRISAFKADPKSPGGMKYAEHSLKEELQNNRSAVLVKIAAWNCAYSKETFQEEGNYYTTHIWITGVDNIVFECSFTVEKGGDKKPAEDIIATLEARKDNVSYPLEIIPIRILEIGIVNEAFDWTSSTVKKILKKDFTGSEADLPKLQQLIDGDKFNAKQKDAWQSFGIAFGVILDNEIDGMQWVTVIDANRELPALQFKETDLVIYPQQLIWNKIKNDQACDLNTEFETIKDKVITLLSEEKDD